LKLTKHYSSTLFSIEMSKHNLIQLHFPLPRDLLYTTQLPGHTLM